MAQTEEPMEINGTQEPAVTEAAVPEQAIPEAAVQEPAVPEQAIPEVVVPEQTVPEPAVPEPPAEGVPDKAERVKNGRHTFSRIGLGCALMGLITYGLSLIFGNMIALINPGFLEENMWLAYAIQYGSLYCIGFPAFLFCILRLPRVKEKEKSGLGFRKFVAIVCICFTATVVGAFVSTLINNLLSDSFGLDVSELIESALFAMEWYIRILLVVIIAPLMEEVVFRKLMIDRMRVYGERLAVITSGLMFGLFHGNLSQLVYATLLGIIFGYVYLRTGRLRYTMALHFIINGFSTLVSFLLTSLDPDAMQTMLESDLTDTEKIMSILSPAVIGISLLSALQYALAVVGIVMFIIYVRKVHFRKAEQELPFGRRFATVWLNPGMLFFLVIVFAEFVISYLVA